MGDELMLSPNDCVIVIKKTTRARLNKVKNTFSYDHAINYALDRIEEVII